MWYIIETIQVILYIFLGIFSITAFIKISQKLNRSAEQLQQHRQNQRRLEENVDIPNIQNATDSEIFPSKNASLKKGYRLLSGEKIYLNESDLAALIATIQHENEHTPLDSRRPLQTRF